MHVILINLTQFGTFDIELYSSRQIYISKHYLYLGKYNFQTNYVRSVASRVNIFQDMHKTMYELKKGVCFLGKLNLQFVNCLKYTGAVY